MAHPSTFNFVKRFTTTLVTMFALASLAHAATYYVSTTGSDTADGKSLKSAWKSVAHAARLAQAGDTVKVAEGRYGPEHILVGNSGSADKPIVL